MNIHPLAPDPADSILNFAVAGGLYFFRYLGAGELWRTDGTHPGGLRLATVSPASFVVVSETVFFVSCDAATGCELWKSDGTPAGTALVKAINPGPGSADLIELTAVGGTLFFGAFDGSGSALWKSDGTAAGTVPVASVGIVRGYSPSSAADVNGTLFFFGMPSGGGPTGLWKSDGTGAGTVLVQAPLNPRTPDFLNIMGRSRIRRTASVNGAFFFAASDGAVTGLGRSDGTPGGVVLVKALTLVRELTDVAGRLFFVATDWATGERVWTTDGTPGGTVPVTSPPGGGCGRARELTAVGGLLFFAGCDAASPGRELWRSDGTVAGTLLVSSSRGRRARCPTAHRGSRAGRGRDRRDRGSRPALSSQPAT